MAWQEYFSRVLGDSFEAAKKRNARMSLRSFSRRLEVAPGMFSEIVRGRRHVTWERAVKIAAAAKFPPAELDRLRKLREVDFERRPRKVLQDSALDLILNPLYYRVLCAFEILPKPASAAAFADFLAADAAEIARVLETLIELGLVRGEGEAYSWNGSHLTTPAGITSEKVQEFFRRDLEAAAAALAVPPADREYTTITFAGNMSEMAAAKTQIREFRERLSDSMHVEPDRIFQLSIQLRPVSKIRDRELSS